MRDKIIQTRVSSEEKSRIKEKAKQCGMTESDYLRSAALGTQVRQIGHDREIMSEVCHMLTIINQLEECEERSLLLGRMNEICRRLKS